MRPAESPPAPVLSADAVRAAARTVGFTLVGLAPAAPLDPAPLTEWLRAGFAADMTWMHRRIDERLDPGRVLAGARTVVALAIGYRRESGERSRVAKYARGGDYHNVHRVRLKRLRKRLLLLDPTVETYACVDTGVAMEKAWAERAGLGFIGKNGLLINRVHGSWLTLSVMFLDRATDGYDTPAENLCGECTRCLTACPTRAFPRPGGVDARRCIAYHSIENRDVVPVPLRRGFAGRVFGCDVCAEVCPFNAEPVVATGAAPTATATAAGEAPPALRPLAALSAAAVAALTQAEFDRLAAGTAMARAQYDGLRRNALLVLGSARDQAARPLVATLSLGDASAVVRDAAAWALAQIDRIPEASEQQRPPQDAGVQDAGHDDGRGDGRALPS